VSRQEAYPLGLRYKVDRDRLAIRGSSSHIGSMILDLSDEQAAALERELTAIIEGDRYPLSPRIQTLREIRNMIRPEPVREPLPERKRYEPPRGGRYRRRGLMKSVPGPPMTRGGAAAGGHCLTLKFRIYPRILTTPPGGGSNPFGSSL
jgi:hypothetical protein